MKRPPKLILLIFFLASALVAASQRWEKVYADTSNFSLHSATIGHKKYIGFLKEQHFYLMNAKGDTLIRQQDYYHQFEFRDFNKDGHKDILLYLASNTPAMIDLFLFVPSTKKFKMVQSMTNFPAAEKITGTKYYYSYHKSGCADLNWDSDLFYIQGFNAICVANISGVGCNDKVEKKDGIYISKVRDEKKVLMQTLPIETIKRFKDYKWGFIKEYWIKNYNRFL